MTESEWFECIAPESMLAHLGKQATARKKRLFACACVRRIWPLLTDSRLRELVELAERSADESIPTRQMQQARLLVGLIREGLADEERRQPSWKTRAELAMVQAVEALLPANAPILQTRRDVRELPDVVSATRTARTVGRAIAAQREERLGTPPTSAPDNPHRQLESLDAVELVHEIFGNPFHSAPVDPAWLTWNETAIPKIARVLYEDGRFDDLPVLGDALEEAGCNDSDILSHCRTPTAHVRGCWVVDALLGKK